METQPPLGEEQQENSETIPAAIATTPSKDPGSAQPYLVLIFGILSIALCCGIFTGFPALFYGINALDLIKEKKLPLESKPLVIFGISCGVFGIVANVILGLFYMTILTLASLG